MANAKLPPLQLIGLDTDSLVHVFDSRVIGRGNFVKNEDRRISRKHACIRMSKDGAFITSLHSNPVFIKKADDTEFKIIPKSFTCPLKDGDEFSLLPDSCIFKVEYTGLSCTNHPGSNSVLNSRRISTIDENHESKGECRSLIHDSTNSGGEVEINEIEQNEPTPKELVDELFDSYVKSKEANEANNRKKCESSGRRSTGTELEASQKKLHNTKCNDTGVVIAAADPYVFHGSASQNTHESQYGLLACEEEKSASRNLPGWMRCNKSSSESHIMKAPKKRQSRANGKVKDPKNRENAVLTKQRRQKCSLGNDCYRKSRVHKMEYCHPNDSDYVEEGGDVNGSENQIAYPRRKAPSTRLSIDSSKTSASTTKRPGRRSVHIS